MGYVGHFAPKPTSACLDVSDNGDGCALFIKRSKLRILSCESKTLALSIAGLTDSGELLEDDKSIMAQNQVALIAVCELVDGDKQGEMVTYDDNGMKIITPNKPPPIIIGTTHLKSSKTNTGERYRQKGILQVLTSINGIYSSYNRAGRTPGESNLHSSSHTLIHPYPHTLIPSYTHTLIHSYTHTLIHSHTRTLIYFTLSVVWSVTRHVKDAESINLCLFIPEELPCEFSAAMFSVK